MLLSHRYGAMMLRPAPGLMPFPAEPPSIIIVLPSANSNNVASDFCFEWERVEKLESGNYLVKLIIEDRIVIQNNFKLR